MKINDFPRSGRAWMVAVAVVATTAVGAFGQTVNNPGFENNTGGSSAPAPGLTQYNVGATIGTTPPGWLVGQNGPIVTPGNAFNIATTYTEINNVTGATLNFNSNSGNFAADITGAGNTGFVTLSQSINFGTSGVNTLFFFLGQMVTSDSRYQGAASVIVYIDSLNSGFTPITLTANANPVGATLNQVNWQLQSVSLANLTGIHTLFFQNNSLTTNYVGLDDITVVPEPATVLGGGGAAALVGFFFARRRKAQVPALA